jgi:hypothetical protein
MFFCFFEPFHPIFALKLAKGANKIKKKCFQKFDKTQNLMLSSNPLKEVQKKSPKNSYKAENFCTQ